ncbi:ion channel [Phormidium sp. CCY1219]|uniref:ion channel n=1 Tax=Phormidium sp. CCY1219 TaxID=2886104 RepID=UPI002D1EBC38|nr:ion channel [Phormidium sp. CCY1219]MEB3826688.1 potassium channel family protein [Phormidium sp. CCY1219]
MPILIIFLGLLILVIVMADVLVTSLTAGGAGPLTGKLCRGAWKMGLRFNRKHSNHRFLTLLGWILLVGIALLWLFLTWVGWTMVFCSFDEAVVNSTTKIPATIGERIYFMGYTLSTLGLGDFQPATGIWQFATAVASANGFFLVTLAIAYLLPVISAVVLKRQIALYITSLGGTPDEIILRAWNGENFGQFDQHLITLTAMMSQMAESYLAYPILNYFHSVERSKVFALSIVTLDDALTLLYYGVPEKNQPDPAALRPARRAVSGFLKTLKSAYIEPASETPPLPPLEMLAQEGIPTVSDEQFWHNTKHATIRRQLLLALVKHDGWTWDAVASMKTTNRGTWLDDESIIDDAELH